MAETGFFTRVICIISELAVALELAILRSSMFTPVDGYDNLWYYNPGGSITQTVPTRKGESDRRLGSNQDQK